MLLRLIFVCLCLPVCGGVSLLAQAVSPERVVVVANAKDKLSVSIAKYYMEQRGIPQGNLIFVEAPTAESISRDDFYNTIFNPLRQQLLDKEWISGVLSGRKDALGRLEMAPLGHKIDFMVLCRIPLKVNRDTARAGIEGQSRLPANLSMNESSVDAELALLAAPPTPIGGPLPNPLFNKKPTRQNVYSNVVRVARLDGRTSEEIRLMIDNALQAEKTGVRGMVYIDLSQRHPDGDKWLNLAADTLRSLHYPVIVEPEKRLMNWRDRVDGAAFYFGWWSERPQGPMLETSYRFPVGALGWNIYSFSMSSLRHYSVWGPILIRDGITGTAGNVFEPYLSLVHRPDLFMEGIAAGMSTGEAAYYSLPALSWMCVYIGDPLYQPLKVDLDAQLQQIAAEPDQPGAQYVVLRQAERLRGQKGKRPALDYLLKSAESVKGLALSYEIARLLADDMQERRAVEVLQPFFAAQAYSDENMPLAFHASELLIAITRREQAYEILKKILTTEKLPEPAFMTYAPATAPLARQFGDAALASEWDERVAQVKERQKQEALKRAEDAKRRAEAAKAAQEAKAAQGAK